MVNYKRGSGNYKSSYLQIVIAKTGAGITSDTTLHDDAELHLPLKANKFYAGYLLMLVNSQPTPKIKYTFKPITGSVYTFYGKGLQKVPATTIPFTSSSNNSTDAEDQIMHIPFTIFMGTTDGTLQFQWAQQVSDAGTTSILRGSMLVCFEA